MAVRAIGVCQLRQTEPLALREVFKVRGQQLVYLNYFMRMLDVKLQSSHKVETGGPKPFLHKMNKNVGYYQLQNTHPTRILPVHCDS